MTDKIKNEELNEAELDQVTGGVAKPTLGMEVVNEDELIGTRKPKKRMEVVNEDEFQSSGGNKIVATGGGNGI